MSDRDNSKAASKIGCAIACVGLAYLGFEYDSGLAFAGALLAYLSI